MVNITFKDNNNFRRILYINLHGVLYEFLALFFQTFMSRMDVSGAMWSKRPILSNQNENIHELNQISFPTIRYLREEKGKNRSFSFCQYKDIFSSNSLLNKILF